MSSLDAATIDRLVQAAQNCGMYGPRRDRLLAGIEPALRARLDEYKKPADQLRSDLETLAEVPPSDDGHPPLAIWLANARFMVDRGRVREAATFAEQWVATYMRWGLDVPPWSDDLAPAKAVPDTVSRTLFGRVVPVALVVFGLIGVVGIALADPASAQGAKAANFGYLACLSTVGLGVSVGLREFLGPNRVLVLIIVIFAALTIGYTFASAVTLMTAEPEPDGGSEKPGDDSLDVERQKPGDSPLQASRDPQGDAMHGTGDDADAIAPTDQAGGIPGEGDARGGTRTAGSRGWLSTAAAQREAPEGFETLPPGDFMMGSPPDEPGRRGNEGPQFPVTFTRPLWVQAHEVTQAEWRALMGTSPSYFDGCDECPVESVNWYEAAAYANARSESEGLPACYRLDGCTGDLGAGCRDRPYCGDGWRCAAADFVGLDCPGYRLPTEAEWEYAARAGSTRLYATGDTADDLDRLGWYSGNSDGRTHPVATMSANGRGLFDMHGNVAEWCQDTLGAYSPARAIDPLGSPRSGAPMMRGGAFVFASSRARSADRGGLRRMGGRPVRYRDVGFRLVRAPRAP